LSADRLPCEGLVFRRSTEEVDAGA
jgi:hypothetical protein